MYATTVLSALLLAGSTYASTGLSTRTHTIFATNAAVTAATGNAPASTVTVTDTRTLTVYNIYGVPATVTPVCSVISADRSAITYKVACPTTGAEECGGLSAPMTVTQGASDLQFASIGSDSKSFSISCDISSDATCIAKNAATTSTYTLTGSQVWPQIPAQITAGGYKLANSSNPIVFASGSGVAAQGTGFTTGRLPPRPTTSKGSSASSSSSGSAAPSSSSPGAAMANAPAVAGSVAGLLLAVLAL
ncbi:hypothetical protein NA57DRAFT_52794 [Rhizodiscina lignyota]|uniref:Uncharacterized protein n=1 Tax=Rhizodiscina lignyota TaxID=1504668 RepID=A0A9P4INU4_9PEZI|nr:hypothetical protein NA57DRAFT_52794 [Rhizodiscina lignyota]